MMSRGAGPSTRSILYCRPEQPPPITARRKAPCGRPRFSSSELRRRAAFSVTLISFSLPILIPLAGCVVSLTLGGGRQECLPDKVAHSCGCCQVLFGDSFDIR